MSWQLRAAMHRRFEADPTLWERRPLPPDLLAYAAGDVAPLPELASRLGAELGNAGVRIVSQLSSAHAEWHFDAADRSSASGTYAYAVAWLSCFPEHVT